MKKVLWPQTAGPNEVTWDGATSPIFIVEIGTNKVVGMLVHVHDQRPPEYPEFSKARWIASTGYGGLAGSFLNKENLIRDLKSLKKYYLVTDIVLGQEPKKETEHE